jgi:hypothetical protein
VNGATSGKVKFFLGHASLLHHPECVSECEICRSGFGRAGMMAACILLLLGEASSASDAIAKVRRLRGERAVQTTRQAEFVERYAKSLVADKANCADMVETLSSVPEMSVLAG